MKNFTLTNHAVEQFASRWLPDHASWHAEQDLHHLLSTAKKVGRTRAGDIIYASGHRPEVRMVVKDRNVCVTVLPPREEQDDQETIMQQYYEGHKEQTAERVAALEKKSKDIDNQREELKAIYRTEMEMLQTKKDEINSELSWLNRYDVTFDDTDMERAEYVANAQGLAHARP